ncbi:MAG TPA: hypothetical protein VHD90_00860 [Phototrophicaceae bacterium]|nr:hypothetical protein [Phototrophicaceae bacterium]
MSIYVEWDNEDLTVILWSFVGRWTWGELDDAIKSLNAMLENVEHPVDFIFDLGDMAIMPPDVISAVKAKYLHLAGRPRRLLAVGVDQHLRLFWDTFTDLPYARSLKMRYFDSIDAARQYIHDNPT